MASSFLTVADLVKFNSNSVADLDMSDVLNMSPFVAAANAVIASDGTVHKYVKETTAPTAGFRAINAARENSKSVDTLVTVTMQLLDATLQIDKGLLKGGINGAEPIITREAVRHLRSGFFSLEEQIFYGTDSSAGGFTGLAEETDLDGLADSQVVSAGGTTASTASSCWLVRSADDGLSVVTGNDGNIEVGSPVEVFVGSIADGGFAALQVSIMGYYGLQRGSKHDVVRIANITEDSGKGLTDALIAEALSKFRAGMGATHVVMNRRSIQQLQASRTATNSTGAPAPFPTEAFGVPIVVTDAISSTEALLA